MKTKIKITADRMIDLSVEDMKRRDISTMSCYINMGGESYEDSINVNNEEIYDHWKKTGEIAKTAAKSPDDYYNFFKQFTDKGRPVIHFAASKGVSAICEFSIKASERLPNVYVVDTRSLSGGAALLADYAEELMAGGETDAKKIQELCIAKRDKIQDSFMIDRMDFMRTAGRVTGLQFFVANLLQLKPVITLNKTTGLMFPREKCRGNTKKALVEYVKSTFKKYPNPDLRRLYVAHSSKDEEMVKYFIDTIASHYKFEDTYIATISCNCFVHSGPNTFGMFYLMK